MTTVPPEPDRVSAGAAACAPTGAASPPPAAPAEVPPAALPPRPWGFWATLGLSLAIVAGSILTVGISMVPFAVLETPLAARGILIGGLALELSGITVTVPGIGLVFLFAWLRRRRYPLREYLGLVWPTAPIWGLWLGIELVKCAAVDGATYLLGRDVVPQVMVDDYRRAFFLPLFLLAVIVTYPAVEEFFFRGFVLEGLRCSAIGPIAAVLGTAAIWAILHQQYDWYGILIILIDGIVLGIARLRTNSIWLCIMMHATGNMLATVETVIKVHLLA